MIFHNLTIQVPIRRDIIPLLQTRYIPTLKGNIGCQKNRGIMSVIKYLPNKVPRFIGQLREIFRLYEITTSAALPTKDKYRGVWCLHTVARSPLCRRQDGWGEHIRIPKTRCREELHRRRRVRHCLPGRSPCRPRRSLREGMGSKRPRFVCNISDGRKYR